MDDIVTVTEDETAAAILSLMENQKLVAEGAGAVPVAAALFHKLPIEGKKVVCLISGGNIDVNILNRVITRGLVMSGRKANLTIALEDKPGKGGRHRFPLRQQRGVRPPRRFRPQHAHLQLFPQAGS